MVQQMDTDHPYPNMESPPYYYIFENLQSIRTQTKGTEQRRSENVKFRVAQVAHRNQSNDQMD